MVEFEGKVDSMHCARTSNSFDADPKENKDLAGKLEKLSEETSAFLEVVFSTTLYYADHRKWISHIRNLDCYKIRCPKLDLMLATVLPKDVIKADSYLSRLQQFWLGAVAPLTAILEGSEAGKLMAKQAHAAAQSALCLLDNADDHMTQEDSIECQPRLEIYSGGGKCFPAGSANAIWRGIHKERHRQSGSSKGYQEDHLLKVRGKTSKLFFRIPPWNQQAGCRDGFRSSHGRSQLAVPEDHS